MGIFFEDTEGHLNRLLERIKSGIETPSHFLSSPAGGSGFTPSSTPGFDPRSFLNGSTPAPLPSSLLRTEGAAALNLYRSARQAISNANAGLLVVALDSAGKLTQRFAYLSKTTLDCLSEFLLSPSPTLAKLNRTIYHHGCSRRSNTSGSTKVGALPPFLTTRLR